MSSQERNKVSLASLKAKIVCVFTMLAALTLVASSILVTVVLLVIRHQDYAIANAMFFGVYPLALLVTWLFIAIAFFFALPIFRAILFAFSVLLLWLRFLSLAIGVCRCCDW